MNMTKSDLYPGNRIIFLKTLLKLNDKMVSQAGEEMGNCLIYISTNLDTPRLLSNLLDLESQDM